MLNEVNDPANRETFAARERDSTRRCAQDDRF
jgi:hypothetical protein